MIPLQKDAFSIDDDICYLNCAYMSPQLQRCTEAGQRAAAAKATPWRVNVEDFFAPVERARALFAGLIGASGDDIAIIPSISYGMAVASLNLSRGGVMKPGANIVVLEEQFPSNVYPWLALAREYGGAVRTVKRPPDQNWAASVEAIVDSDTAIVALPHCHWTDGGLIDLARVRRCCDGAGAALVIDATQSIGALPFSVAVVRPDFLVAAAYKWLLGPYSLGFMYVDPRYHQGYPLEHGWICRENSEDFAGLVNYREGFQPGARRFDMGERSQFVLMPIAIEALLQLHAWGVDNIAATLSVLTAEIAARAQALGLGFVPEAARAPHLTGIEVPAAIAPALNERLRQEKIFVSLRGKSLRIAPHLYNSPADIARLFEVLEERL